MQTLLRNPLADPYVLGVSSGAAVGALAAIVLGAAGLSVAAAAFAGAIVVMALVFALAHGAGPWSATRLILTGVIVASGASAVVALLLTLAPEQRLHSMLFWLMGDAAGTTFSPWPMVLLIAVSLLLVTWGRDLNALAYGEATAQAVGVPVARLRWGLYVLASLLTATAVTLVGSVGFVGLMIGNDHRWLIPCCIFAGGTLLMVADTAARTLWAPLQLPVGIVTALLGVPFFLWLLVRART
jgi:iron complex transport system permease protein